MSISRSVTSLVSSERKIMLDKSKSLRHTKQTPLDDAKQFGHQEVVAIFEGLF